MKDYVAIAKQYARDAAKSKKHGKWSKLGCKRFLNDLKRAKSKKCDFYFSDEHAVDACSFAENLQHVEGTWESPYIILHESMIFFYVNLYGFRKHVDDTRRFTDALWASGRKNAKSTGLGAPISLYSQFEEGHEGAQVISAAPTSDQSRIVWFVAKRMVEKDREFQDYYNCKAFSRTIAGYGNGSVYKYITSKASSHDGLNPNCSVLDEVHQIDYDLLNVVKSAAGARPSPLFLYLTTEGYSNENSPWSEMRRFSHQILSGIVEADHFLTLMFCVDDEDDEFDEDVWIKANPLMEVNPYLMDAIRKDAAEAKQMSGKAAEFRVKRLNKPSTSADSFIDLSKWNKCDSTMTLDELEGFPCWGALDLASNSDLTSFRLLWLVGGVYYTHGWRYCCSESVHYKKVSGTSAYPAWVESGLLIETEGATVNHETIRKNIVEQYERFKPLKLVADTWNAMEVIRKLDESSGIEVEPFIQGAKSYHPAIKKFEKTYKDGHLAHGGDLILTWCATNLVVKFNENANMMPDKKKSADKIDDMVSLIMCFGASLDYEVKRSFDDIMKNKVSVNL